MARALQTEFAGNVPCSVSELLTLPYVGLYVSCAVACFGFSQRVPIVDANVVRVIGRLAGLDPKKDLRRSSRVWEIAWLALPQFHVEKHNYGLLDFSAQICTSRAPKCDACALQCVCSYGKIAASGETKCEGPQ